MYKPRISVVMSVYKEPVEWLRQSIDSILNQTFSDFEFIIICDNPAYKEGITTLKEYSAKDNRIRLIFNEENIGLTKSLNKGLAIAQGEYIARMDADDISMHNRFERQILFMDSHPEIGVCHTSYKKMNSVGNPICEVHLKDVYAKQEFLFILDMICHPTVMFRSNLIQLRRPLYNEDFRNAQDYELWTLMLLENVKFSYIDEVLLLYRISTAQISNKTRGLQENNGRAIRRNLINRYLLYRYEISESGSPYERIKAIDNISEQDLEQKSYLICIKYILYFKMSRQKPSGIICYLMDRNRIFLKMPLKMTIYILGAFFLKNRWRLLDY